jgi:PadR family transcriptional regulator AphA
LREPGVGPALEFEALLKIGFADSGSRSDVLANLDATRVWVLAQNEENLATARAYLEGRGTFPERAALNQLTGKFLTDFYGMTAQWVRWASSIVEAWPDDVRDAPFDPAVAEEAVRQAEGIPALVTEGP